MNSYEAKPMMGFVEAFKVVNKKFFVYSGRSRRSEYWWATLALGLISWLTSWIPVVSIAASIYTGLLGISMQFRRLHDIGKSGWWEGATFILSFIWLGILFFITGDFEALLQEDVEAIFEGLKSGNTFAVTLFCIITIILCLLGLCIFIFSLLDSDIEENKYGKSPKYFHIAQKEVEDTAGPTAQVLD